MLRGFTSSYVALRVVSRERIEPDALLKTLRRATKTRATPGVWSYAFTPDCTYIYGLAPTHGATLAYEGHRKLAFFNAASAVTGRSSRTERRPEVATSQSPIQNLFVARLGAVS